MTWGKRPGGAKDLGDKRPRGGERDQGQKTTGQKTTGQKTTGQRT